MDTSNIQNTLTQAILNDGSLSQRINLLSDKQRRQLFEELSKYMNPENGFFSINDRIRKVIREENTVRDDDFHLLTRIHGSVTSIQFQQYIGLPPYTYQKSYDDCYFQDVSIIFVGKMSFIYETSFFENDAITPPTQRVLIEFVFTEQFRNIIEEISNKIS